MVRPFPAVPRGNRCDERQQSAAGDPILLLCPRISPEFQFRARVALIKPQFKHAIAHRSGRQVLPRSARRVVSEAIESSIPPARPRPRVHFRRSAEHLLSIAFGPAEKRAARAVAVHISARLPDLWFLLDNRLLHGGRFYRRQGRYRLVPVSMRVPRLPRDLFLTLLGASHARFDPASPRVGSND